MYGILWIQRESGGILENSKKFYGILGNPRAYLKFGVLESWAYFIRFLLKNPYTFLICTLGIDTTFNLGHFFVTPTTFRNTALENRRTKKTPVFCGPTMIHYRNDSQSYEELLEYLRRELRDSSNLVIGSDGAPGIKSTVEAVFLDSIHLFVHDTSAIISSAN